MQNERRDDDYQTKSLGVRETQQAQASAVFREYPITGAGIRYYDETRELAKDGRPSSLLYEVTAESGIVGAVDVALLLVGLFLVLRRLRSPYATAAMAVLGVKVVHALFDNFWVAGPFTLPWLIIGVAVALEYEEADTEPEQVRAPRLTPRPVAVARR